jgi:transposase
MQIVREYTYAFGAVSPEDGTLDSLVLPVVTAEAMSIFLEEVARRHPEEFILMFLDGAGRHRANDLAVPKNMRLEALPPYSPQLNPVEHIRDEIREKWFANEVFNSLDAVEDRLVEALVAAFAKSFFLIFPLRPAGGEGQGEGGGKNFWQRV